MIEVEYVNNIKEWIDRKNSHNHSRLNNKVHINVQ